MKKCMPRRWDQVELMHRLQQVKHGAIQAALQREGLQDVGQPKILFLLGEAEENGQLPAQQELAKRLRVSPATIAASLKSLERMGYISRETDRADARKKRIAITEKGWDARQRCLAIFEEVDERMLSGFTGQELAALRGAYERMLENLAPLAGGAELCLPPPICCKKGSM